MRVFIPAEDGPFDAFAGPLVPYRYGLVCEGALRHAPSAMVESVERRDAAAVIECVSSAGSVSFPARSIEGAAG